MKYVVLSPARKIICFDHGEQVAQYCDEKERSDIDAYCKDQQYTYETMSAVDVGYVYTLIGAEAGVCYIYETKDVLKHMKELQVESDLIDATADLFNDRRLNEEIDCPGYLSDVLMDLTPMTVSQLLDPLYTMQNIDEWATEGNE